MVKPLLATSRMASYYATPILPLARGKVRYVGEPVVGRRRRKPLSRRGCARADRDRFRAAARRHRSGRGRATARRCCTKKPAPTCWSRASSSAATSMPRSTRRRCGSAAASACAARPPIAIEPRACLAEYEAGRDALTLHSATQVPGIVRDALVRRARPARPPAARGRARRRRRLRRQGLALSGGDFRLRGRAAACARRSNGPATAWRILPPPARPSTRSSTPSSALDARRPHAWRCAPT